MTMNGRGKVVAIVGGQYGSEGKGVICHHLADQFDIAVRVGGPNAGHSFWFQHPEGHWTKEVVQQLPVAWTNKDATLVIGPGAVVDLEQLRKEMAHVHSTFDPNIRQRVRISAHAFPLTGKHHSLEGGTEGDMHRKIGSTGHGVGAARHDRMARDPSTNGTVPIGQMSNYELRGYGLGNENVYEDIPSYLHSRLLQGGNVLLEGTQGSGLSLIHGPWPYCTSADTNAAQLIADAGIGPRLLDRIIMVCRTYPIRVAGNSGPMHNEITWEELNRRMGKSGITEQTTVTKKTRRIAEWDEDLVLRASVLNTPTDIAITFLDYISPEDEGKECADNLSFKSRSFIEYVETLLGISATLCGTGGPHWSVIERGWKL
jgi:adenylosuccinate synthase